MNSKAIVLENGFEIDIPEELIDYMNYQKIEYQCYDMRERFWKENRESTFKFFSELPEGQLLMCHTTFEDFQQLELIIQLLHKLKHKHFKFMIMHGCLAEDLLKFYEETESSITPSEFEKQLEGELTDEEVYAIYDNIHAFKTQMNEKFLEVLEVHEVYWIGGFKDYLLNNMEDIKNAIRD